MSTHRIGAGMQRVADYGLAHPGCIIFEVTKKTRATYDSVACAAKAKLIVIREGKSHRFGRPVFRCYPPEQEPTQ